jgi:hypothetical protein
MEAFVDSISKVEGLPAHTANIFEEEGLTRELSSVSSPINEEDSGSSIGNTSPISNNSGPVVNRSSAVETAPVAARTASVSNNSGQSAMQIVASDVNIDGHLVGRVMFQISRRA